MSIQSDVILLTPKLASELMRGNKNNRPKSDIVIKKYADAMTRGEWRTNGEPIIIFQDGTLGDGQHRCLAVIKSGVAIKTVITKGVDKSTFGTINCGKSRKASDVLAIGGEYNSVQLAAAARVILEIELSRRDTKSLTAVQIADCIERHPLIRKWVSKHSASCRYCRVIDYNGREARV